MWNIYSSKRGGSYTPPADYPPDDDDEEFIWTPLLGAVAHNDNTLLMEILKSDTNVDVKAWDLEATALILSVRWGRQDCFQLLLDHGARVNIADVFGMLPLHWAVERNNVIMLKKLIEFGSTLDSTSLEGGNTALHIALMTEQLECVEVLLDAGADINIKNRAGRVALHYAAMWGNDQIFMKLLEMKSDVLTNNDGLLTLFEIIIINDRIEYFDVLLYSGVDITMQGSNKNTLLHIASKFGNEGVLKRVLEFNLDVDAQDEEGYTPLHLACCNWKLQNVHLLLEAGARYDIIDQLEKTMLGELLMDRHIDRSWYADIPLIRSILERTDDVMITDSMLHETAAHAAVRLFPRFFELTKLVIAMQKSLNIKDNWGQTIVNKITEKARDYPQESLSLIRLCVEHGAYLNRRDCDRIRNLPIMRDDLLQDKHFCIQSILNKFNSETLPQFYECLQHVKIKWYSFRGSLIVHGSGAWKCIEGDVMSEIEREEYCDVSRLMISSLSIRCIESFCMAVQGRRELKPSFFSYFLKKVSGWLRC